MDIGTIAFFIAGVVATAAAIAMVATRNMIYSILFMVVVFLATAVIYLLFQAPVIAFLQITVYAGGIMVLFLFVIMLIGVEKMPHSEPLRWQRPIAFGLAGLLLGETIFLVSRQVRGPDPVSVGTDFGSPQEIGLMLFNKYTMPFEIISLLLLIAVIGVIVLNVRKGVK